MELNSYFEPHASGCHSVIIILDILYCAFFVDFFSQNPCFERNGLALAVVSDDYNLGILKQRAYL